MFLKDIFNFKQTPTEDQDKDKRNSMISNNSTHDRAFSISSSASSSQASTPLHSNLNKQSINHSLGDEDLDNSLKIYTKNEWVQVIKTKNKESTSYSELKANLRKGIPKSLRPRIWFWLADVKKNQYQYERGIYQRLSSHINPEWDSEIKKDINRTIVESEFFQGEDSLGQKQLYKILNAFCNIDVNGIGYAQGMNVIVATILLTLHDKRNFKNPKKSFGKADVTNDDIEEWSFWIIFYIMQEKNHHKIYQKTMVMRKQLLESLENRIKQDCPKVMEVMKSHNVDFGLAFDQDFFSIMSYKCPLPLSQFVMDMFLLDGHRAIIDIISRIILINEEEFVQSKEIDDVLYFLKQKKNEESWKKCRKNTHKLVPFQYLQYEN